MRVFGHNRSQGPSWMVAIVIFVGLLLLLHLGRGGTGAGRPLEQHFAAGRPEPRQGQLTLPPLPSSVAGMARTAAARIAGGRGGPALTPVAEGSSLRVEITNIRRQAAGLQIKGLVANTGSQPLPVSLGEFRFTDGTGTVYTAESAASTLLQPGQRAPLDLTLPIANTGDLTLDVQVEGEAPLRMVLIQGSP
ncbi:MAG: hypothetical protein AVDCRST_MAG26-332 [uncultured Chloroflexia bacterium]|uniref:Uncharacterized protein n=1 Tax=uncultured Chloroflexia bacterium TaxID=1672391 RepID=A0A6J4H899_9CHLR|nr:MAG: hypothetical protein AVDCRST_MAG26-332 [uncultured Chloroflexia bacterium]